MSTKLKQACEKGVPALKKYLQTHGIDERDEGHNYPIHVAARKENGVLEYLIEQGADINIQDVVGETALHYAVEMEIVGNVIALLDAGADTELHITQSTSSYISAGSTPLSVAEGWRLYAEWHNKPTDDLDIIIHVLKIHKEKTKLESSMTKEQKGSKQTRKI
ncbi:MAG TPA: ankyrin repeat domain-containing protein [Anaerovoracaceae bacterium]|nr:ankyrin repeat domain-containing protein [Anaerovoracaceae bacterium]